MQQYVDLVDNFLEALLSREVMPDPAGTVTNLLRFGDARIVYYPPLDAERVYVSITKKTLFIE